MSPREQRLGKLRERMASEGLGALLVAAAPNVRYLTGFAGEGQVVVGAEQVALATDGRYKVEANQALSDLVKKGQVTLEEALTKSSNPKQLKSMLQPVGATQL